MSDCPVDPCNRPTVPGWGLCRHHAWTLERALAEAPALSRELDMTITRQTCAGARSGSRSTTRPLPLDLAASEALTVLQSTLAAWVRELGFKPRGDAEVLARVLLRHHHQLVIHPDADQAVDEILAATANGWRCTDRRDRARLTLPDPCPDCGHTLHAVLHDIGDPRPNLVWCAGPEPHRWEPVQWLRLGHRLGYGREAAG